MDEEIPIRVFHMIDSIQSLSKYEINMFSTHTDIDKNIQLQENRFSASLHLSKSKFSLIVQ